MSHKTVRLAFLVVCRYVGDDEGTEVEDHKLQRACCWWPRLRRRHIERSGLNLANHGCELAFNAGDIVASLELLHLSSGGILMQSTIHLWRQSERNAPTKVSHVSGTCWYRCSRTGVVRVGVGFVFLDGSVVSGAVGLGLVMVSACFFFVWVVESLCGTPFGPK